MYFVNNYKINSSKWGVGGSGQVNTRLTFFFFLKALVSGLFLLFFLQNFHHHPEKAILEEGQPKDPTTDSFSFRNDARFFLVRCRRK